MLYKIPSAKKKFKVLDLDKFLKTKDLARTILPQTLVWLRALKVLALNFLSNLMVLIELDYLFHPNSSGYSFPTDQQKRKYEPLIFFTLIPPPRRGGRLVLRDFKCKLHIDCLSKLAKGVIRLVQGFGAKRSRTSLSDSPSQFTLE